MLDRGPETLGQEPTRKRAMRIRAVEGDAQKAIAAFDHLRTDKPVRIDYIHHRRFAHVENCRVEQRPTEHVFIAHRLGKMVDPRQSCRRCGLGLHLLELDVPDIGKRGTLVDEMEHGPRKPTDRRDRKFTRADRLDKGLGPRGNRPLDHIIRRRHHQTHVTNRRAACVKGMACVPFRFLVQHDADVPLLPKRKGLVAVVRPLAETECGQNLLERPRLFAARCKLDKRNALGRNPLRDRREVDRKRRLGAAHIVHQRHKRAIPVFRHLFGIGATELVVENLETDRPLIARRHHRPHKSGDIEIALTGHIAKVPRPIKKVHLDQRCISKLHKEYLVPGDRSDALGRQLATQSVETVEDKTDILVIGAAHDFPCITVIVDVAPPSQSLISDPKPPCLGPFTERVEIRRRAVDPAKRLRMHARTNKDEIRAQLLHKVELAFCTVKSLGAKRLGQPLEIPKRLEQRNIEPMIADHLADVTRASVIGNEILLENFDAVEPCGGNRFKLFPKVS